jgi:hypothetical protein
MGKCWSILWPLGVVCGHLVYVVVIWYISTVLVCCTKKNLSTLLQTLKWVHILVHTRIYEAPLHTTLPASGANVMVTLFGDFRQFSEEK